MDEVKTKTALDQADDLIKELLDRARDQFRSTQLLNIFLREQELFPGKHGSRSRTAVYRVMNGHQRISARDFLAILISMGWTIEVNNEKGQLAAGAKDGEILSSTPELEGADNDDYHEPPKDCGSDGE